MGVHIKELKSHIRDGGKKTKQDIRRRRKMPGFAVKFYFKEKLLTWVFFQLNENKN